MLQPKGAKLESILAKPVKQQEPQPAATIEPLEITRS